MEVSTDDTSIKEYLSKYALNEQSIVASKLTKIGISYIIKTNGSKSFPSLKELETIINTLSTSKRKTSPANSYQKKILTHKAALKDTQFKTPTFGKKVEEPKKRAQTVEGKQIKMKRDGKLPIKQSPPYVESKDEKKVQVNEIVGTKEKRIKEPIVTQHKIKPRVMDNKKEKDKERIDQIMKENPYQSKNINIEDNKLDTPQSIKKIDPPTNQIDPNTQLKSSNYHFQQEHNITEENKPKEKERYNPFIMKKEEKEVLKEEDTVNFNQNQLTQPQVKDSKLKYDYPQTLTEPHLSSSYGYSFRERNPSYHQSCYCNHNYNYHYPHYSYYSPTEPVISTESSLSSSHLSFDQNKYNYTDRNNNNNQTLSSKYSLHSKYEPRSSFTYEISHR